jgi:tricorn protease-like protein
MTNFLSSRYRNYLLVCICILLYGCSDANTSMRLKAPLLFFGILITTIDHPAAITEISWSSNGNHFSAIASGINFVQVTQYTSDGKRVGTIPPNTNQMRWSPNGQILAVVEDNTIHLWDKFGTHVKTITNDKGQISNLAWSPDNQFIAAISNQTNSIYIWHANGYLLHSGLVGNWGAPLLTWSPNSKILATHTITNSFSSQQENLVVLWSLHNNNTSVVTTTAKGSTYKQAAIWSPDTKKPILTTILDDNSIQLLDAEGQTIEKFRGHKASIDWLSWSPNGNLLASSSLEEKKVIIWSKTGEIVSEFTNFAAVNDLVKWSPDSKKLTIIEDYNVVKLWDVEDKKVYNLGKHGEQVFSLDWNYSNNLLAVVSDSTVRIWSKNGEVVINNLVNQPGIMFFTAKWSPNGMILTVGGDDNKLRIWR